MKLFLAIMICCIMTNCTKDKLVSAIQRPANCDSTRFTFEQNILPILNANCNFTECHAPAGRGAYDYTNYAVVVNRVKAGTFEYRLELPVSDPQHMPEKFSISQCDYFQIKMWIQQGYPEK